ncbi:MAG: response regulator transcription factor [Lactobacillus sp.]|jgi:two-component system alkaline phosphatase synthesis response regulator PhoP|uniref:Response regulator n=1 Tax=Lacticaseibacillus suilingensis TaxID=2799577 RepID=A0ABW4BF10_9LACO|nr:response regulator transcription factor [Lacticaseibacillus suilingensis]MCI1893590.1 response regulator transcription factor [Lactobacillus sp.]MCI1941222.1 response regulator transcription factor [Lactobacillus sp.]MCI1971766.1 response regulator transcription factor [Lactobacillus sp.]MCI2016206.1 response regulator transcription factor [Lactobacillus sp.]MCI2038202.1 response regulator transcription factor [Lactobacillus sp.]
MKKILVVDDEPAIVTLLQYNLEKEHYAVTTAGDGDTALSLALQQNFDFIILDLMLPGLDGLEVTKKIRAADNKTPIMILTAKDSETDKIVGLELGADDYVTKPFSPREIVARIKAIERRVQAPTPTSAKAPAKILSVGELVIDPDNYQATKNGERLQLTPKEFELLVFFAQRVGKILSRDALLNGVWGFEYPAETRMVDIQVSHLRDKIEVDPKHPDYIKTVRGFGYQMEAPNE